MSQCVTPPHTKKPHTNKPISPNSTLSQNGEKPKTIIYKLKVFFSLGWKGIIKTIRYNFKLFSITKAWHFPLLLSSKTTVVKAERGSIILTSEIIHFGMFRIGVSHLRNSFQAPCFVKIEGKLIIHGEGYHNIAPGGNLTIRSTGILEIGNNFSIGHFCKIIITTHSIIGDNNLHSWENLYMDDDLHPIFDEEGNRLNKPQPLIFGNNVWIGARCTILKGVTIADGVIVASRSLITKDLSCHNSIYASQRIIKSNIRWGVK